MSRIFDWAIFMLTPVRWPTVPRRVFLVLLPVGVLYLIAGWCLLCLGVAVTAMAFTVFYGLTMAVGVPAFWCWQQVSRLWTGAEQ
jgi:hypothetical protein